jgi:hypothetical protein
VAYQSDESGQWGVYIDSFPTPGHRVRVSTAGGQYPQWAPDGSELFYVAGDATLMSVGPTFDSDKVSHGTPRALFRPPAVDPGRHPYDVSLEGTGFSCAPLRPRRDGR